jgi:hypothetical protein
MPNIIAEEKRELFARQVCLFAAEHLRDSRLTLKQVREIISSVADNINLVDTEEDALKLIQELSKDYHSLIKLERMVSINLQSSSHEKMKILVLEFVGKVLVKDPKIAAEITEEAVKDNIDIDGLANKFPEFKNYLLQKDVKS